MSDAASQTFTRGGEYRRGPDDLVAAIHRVTDEAEQDAKTGADVEPLTERIKQRLQLVLPSHVWFRRIEPTNGAMQGLATVLSVIFGVEEDQVEQAGAGYMAIWTTPDGSWEVQVVNCAHPGVDAVNVRIQGHGAYSDNKWRREHSTADDIINALVVFGAVSAQQAAPVDEPAEPAGTDRASAGEAQLPGDGGAGVGSGV